LSFNGATAFSSTGDIVSGVQQSTSPSWSGTDTSFAGFNQPADVNPSNTLEAIVLNHVSYQWVNYRWTLQKLVNGHCTYTSYDRYMNDVYIFGMAGGSSSFSFGTLKLPALFGGGWNYLHAHWVNFYNVTQVGGAPATQLYQIMMNAQSYNAAQVAYNNVQNALSYITAGIGAAAIVAGVIGLIPGFGSVATVAVLLSALAELAGFASLAMSAFSSISYSTTAHVSIEMVGYSVTSGNPSLSCRFYEAAQTTSISPPSQGTFYPNMPMMYVIASQV